MVAGGKPAKRRVVVSVAVGGTVVASAVLGANTCCTPITAPPSAPPTATAPPSPPVDATPPALDGGAADASGEPQCVFATPRERSLKRRASRIVGGSAAEPGAFPFAVALATSSRFQYCGGSVANARHVRTAAHCQADVGDLVLVGSNDLRKARAVRVTESRIHPGYDPVSKRNDVAVVVLESDVGVPSVQLATGTNVDTATVVGWGRLSEGGQTTPLLQFVNVDVLNDATCAAAYGPLDPTQLCAGKLGGGKDSCQGDSGGPLLTWNVDHWDQLGFVSFGAGCARPDAPGVYADARDPDLAEWLRVCSKS